MIDDLKPNIGPYGDPIARTPAFDRIAASGVTFMNNYCQFPLSGPTRASVLTGLRPDHTGVWTLDGIFRRNNPEIVSLPQLFAAHGYETVGIGKVYHPLSDETYNNDPVSWTKPYIKPQAPVYMLPEGKPVTECVDVPDNAYFDGRVADEAVAWIDSLSRSDKPFFLAVGFIRPHLPFVAPEKYWDLYDRDKMPLAEFQSMSSDPVPCAYHNSNEVKAYTDVPSFHSYMPGQELDAEIQRRLVHGYYACTSYTDAQIGRVLDALRKVGLDDNTIVVVWGDHGYHLSDHGLWSKLTNFEAPTRTLLMMSVPGMTRGQQCRTMTEFVDIYPTVCELAGIPPVLHMGSCVDISRMMILASDIAKDWGIHISQVPVVGCAPEWMSEKAVSIGNYVVATGIETFLGVDPYTKGSEEVTALLQGEHGVKDWVEAKFVVETDIEKLGDKMIECIEAKRAALGI